MFRLVVALSVFGAFSRAAIGPTGDLNISNVNLAPDGVPRMTVLAGGTFPGPLITGKKGDNFQLNVINSLTNSSMLTSTSIHWHGLFQHGTNYADGAAFVTQCPIAAGNSFLYDFSVPDQAGTFWYHSHLGVQYCDGLRGAFIVYDGENGVNDPHRRLYDVDDENTVITLADWYHADAETVAKLPQPVAPDATLINGKGRFGATPTADLAVVNVEHGKRYRLRLLSISCDVKYTFSVDGHDLSVIEADGVNHKPVTVNSITLLSGQRYSAILNANQRVGNYWIRGAPSSSRYTGFANGINSAILRYTGAPVADPRTSIQTNVVRLTEDNLHPLESPGAPGTATPGGADVVLNMTLGFSGGRFTINGVSFIPPTMPVLLQILSGAQTAQDLLPSGSVYTLPPNKVIEVNLHPFHLHGHTFDVVKTAGSNTYNFADPVRRDVTAVAAGNTTAIRFTTDNPGPWFLHCHIDFHLEAGLAVVFAEDIGMTSSVNPVKDDWEDLCPLYSGQSSGQL
ncbi:laccase [Hymenopellis radicata]|nr:laccase [Hymenopellis radicata]